MNFSIKKTGLFISALGFVALSNTALAEVQNATLTGNGEVTASTCNFTFTNVPGDTVTSLTLDSISQSEILQSAAGDSSTINEQFFNLKFDSCVNTQNINVTMTSGAVSGAGSEGVTIGVFAGNSDIEITPLQDINIGGASSGLAALALKYVRNVGSTPSTVAAGALTRDFSFQITYL